MHSRACRKVLKRCRLSASGIESACLQQSNPMALTKTRNSAHSKTYRNDSENCGGSHLHRIDAYPMIRQTLRTGRYCGALLSERHCLPSGTTAVVRVVLLLERTSDLTAAESTARHSVVATHRLVVYTKAQPQALLQRIAGVRCIRRVELLLREGLFRNDLPHHKPDLNNEGCNRTMRQQNATWSTPRQYQHTTA
jgi:hypothetical protein